MQNYWGWPLKMVVWLAIFLLRFALFVQKVALFQFEWSLMASQNVILYTDGSTLLTNNTVTIQVNLNYPNCLVHTWPEVVFG